MSNKLTQSQIDGVQYRKAKLWQIILYSCNSLVGMGVYVLIGLASYSASIGYGVSTVILGIILTSTRILDGITDPILAFVYDKVNTKFGKLRILMIGGFLIEAIALLCMFNFMSSKGFNWVVFTLLYVIYILGYTITNMTAQTIPAIMSNDPKQRPTIGVWATGFNYLVPMLLNVVLTSVLLPKFGGEYNQAFLNVAAYVCVGVAALGTALVCIGISDFDKPEYFKGLKKKKEPLSIKKMAKILAKNKPLQCYIISAATDKLAQQTAAQSIVTTLIFGIVIGNIGLSTILSVIAMLPSIIFAVFGAKYAGKHGSKKAIVDWTWIALAIGVALIIFFIIINPKDIANMFSIPMILFVLITLAFNGAKMCITTANTSFTADIIDYELDRSGDYVPAVITGVYSLIDKIVSAFSATIATAAVAMLGYVNTLPQPGDEMTSTLFWVTMALYYGLPILGWICTLIAMRFCKLDKAEMVEVQKRIAKRKEELKSEEEAELLNQNIENEEQPLEEVKE